MHRIAPPLRIPPQIPLALALALIAAAPAAAGPSWHLGLRAGTFEPTASETYDAVWGDTMVQLGVQAEARWSTIPDALGKGGVSALFGEDDWGGLALNLVLAFRLGG